jgi:hypothetical protein
MSMNHSSRLGLGVYLNPGCERQGCLQCELNYLDADKFQARMILLRDWKQ